MKQNWGPPLWQFIHTISSVEEEYQLKNAIECLKAVKDVIPCSLCRPYYEEKIKELDTLDTTNPKALYQWTIDLHNSVNAKLGKPIWSQ